MVRKHIAPALIDGPPVAVSASLQSRMHRTGSARSARVAMLDESAAHGVKNCFQTVVRAKLLVDRVEMIP